FPFSRHPRDLHPFPTRRSSDLLAPAFTLSTDLVIGSAPPERAGAAAALSETGSELGGALGIAILGTIGTGGYRSSMAHAGSTAADRKSTRLNSSHLVISYAVFC